MPKRNKKKLDGPGQRRIGVGRPRKPPPDESSGCERLDAERSIERSEARCEARSEGDWQKACGEQQRRGELDENSGEPEMHEINSSLEILVDLGELEDWVRRKISESLTR